MTPFETFFDGHLFVINLTTRPDRLNHFKQQMESVGLKHVQLFEGRVVLDEYGAVNGHAGCTASHRALLEMQIANGWPRMFVFEDDAKLIYSDFSERWDRFAAELPSDWDMIYLGGTLLGSQRRLSDNVLSADRINCTQSYGITLPAATTFAPLAKTYAPIDMVYGDIPAHNHRFIINPRLVGQKEFKSDTDGTLNIERMKEFIDPQK